MWHQAAAKRQTPPNSWPSAKPKRGTRQPPNAKHHPILGPKLRQKVAPNAKRHPILGPKLQGHKRGQAPKGPQSLPKPPKGPQRPPKALKRPVEIYLLIYIYIYIYTSVDLSLYSDIERKPGHQPAQLPTRSLLSMLLLLLCTYNPNLEGCLQRNAVFGPQRPLVVAERQS